MAAPGAVGIDAQIEAAGPSARSRGPRGLSVVVLLALLCGAAAAGRLVGNLVESQESNLLEARASEIELVLSSAPAIPATLDESKVFTTPVLSEGSKRFLGLAFGTPEAPPGTVSTARRS